MKHKSFIGEEGLFVEHKEISIHLDVIKTLSPKERDMYINGHFDEKLNTIIIDNIARYVEKYFPRYFSSFHNTDDYGSNEYAHLNFGVTDHGYVAGIPILKNSIGDVNKVVEQKLNYLFEQKIIHFSRHNPNEHNPNEHNPNEKLEKLFKELSNSIEIEIICLKKSDVVDDTNPIQSIIKSSSDLHKTNLIKLEKKKKRKRRV